jgi:hypothetical protein
MLKKCIREAPDGIFGSREIGGKTGWEQGDWAKKGGRWDNNNLTITIT